MVLNEVVLVFDVDGDGDVAAAAVSKRQEQTRLMLLDEQRTKTTRSSCPPSTKELMWKGEYTHSILFESFRNPFSFFLGSFLKYVVAYYSFEHLSLFD